MPHSADGDYQKPQTDADKLAALSRAFELMGIDPEKMAEYVDHPSDATCKAMMLRHVDLDTRELSGDPESWRSMWEKLRLPNTERRTGTSVRPSSRWSSLTGLFASDSSKGAQ